MWIVETNSKEIQSTPNLLDGLNTFLCECRQAEQTADSTNPITVSLIQQVKQDNGAVVVFPYFSNSYK